MSRDQILGAIRRSLGVTGQEAPRRAVAETRLAEPRRGIVPKRADLPPAERVALFMRMAEAVSASVERVSSSDDIPERVADLLRRHNLPQRIKYGEDAYLAALPWQEQATLEVERGRAHGEEAVGLTRAMAGVAETGTLALASGPENPTSLNFLPETHIAVVKAEDIVGDYESVWDRLRERYGRGKMPRTLNYVTGPSRSADIEQTLLLGAHGPRRLHIIVVD